VRTDRYKLIWYYTDDHYEFYDLKEDPHELRNVYGREGYGEQADSLKNELKRLREKYGVPQHVFRTPYVPFSGIGTRN